MKTIFLILGILLSLTVFSQTSDNPYDRQFEASDGLRRVEYKGRFGYIDEKGNELIPLQFAEAADFKDGLAKVSLDKKKYGYINTRGNVVVPLEYEQLYYGFSNGYTPAKKNGQWGLINEKGRLVIPHEYDYLYYPFEGLVIAGKKEAGGLLYGYLNMQAKQVIPFKYTWVNIFSNGLASVKYENKFGFIDTKGATVIPFQFEDAGNFSEGFATVKLNGKWGFIDNTGKMAIRAEFNEARAFSNGEAQVLKGGEGFYIDNQGKRLKNGKWLLVFTKGLNLGEQFWYRGEKWGDELKKKYTEGYRYTDLVWNRFDPELFITMSKSYTYWQSNFYYGFAFDKMWQKFVDNYKDRRSVNQLSFTNGKWTFMLTQLQQNQLEVALNQKSFPWTSIEKHWKEGKFITQMAYGDRWVVIMRNDKYAHQLIRVYENDRWDEADVEAHYKKGYAITDLVKEGSMYFVVFTKGSRIKDQLLLWDEELPLRDIKTYWNKGWQSYRTFYIPRNVTIDKNFDDFF